MLKQIQIKPYAMKQKRTVIFPFSSWGKDLSLCFFCAYIQHRYVHLLLCMYRLYTFTYFLDIKRELGSKSSFGTYPFIEHLVDSFPCQYIEIYLPGCCIDYSIAFVYVTWRLKSVSYVSLLQTMIYIRHI